MDTRAVRATVTGRVQGVGYRMWTLDRARAHGVAGWVRNEPDGTVTAVVQGHDDDVTAMVSELHDGPDWARVHDVTTSDVEVDSGLDGFRIAH